MNRNSKLPLVSSTPLVTKRHKLVFELEKDNISPITTKSNEIKKTTKADGIKKTTKQSQTVNKRTKSTVEVDSVAIKKKRCTARQEKESASSAALKEMGVKVGLRSTNILSKSRNMYNMFPQPVILDSDDESNLQPKKATTTKVRLTKQSNDCATINQHKTKIRKEPSKVMNSAKETPQPSSSKHRAVKKNPVSKLVTTGSTSEQVTKATDKQTEIAQSVADSEDEDSMFPVNLCSSRKNTFIKFPSFKNIFDENSVIKWTPRSKNKNLKMIKEQDSDSESVDSDSDECVTLKTVNVSDMPINRANKENCKDTNKIDVLTKNERIQHRNSSIPKEFSRFSDIVFHPSKQNKGAVIAPSLVTGSSEFGYVHLDEAKLFTGKLKNITFVLLDGQVKALFQGKSVQLSHGDILHINREKGYQLHNIGTGQASLLYVKEKHS